MFRLRLSFAFAVLVALVCCQAAFVYWGSNRVNEYAAHSRLTSDILSELLEISANKQRLRVWASQRLMNAEATSAVRDQLLERMRTGAARLDAMSRLHLDSWRKLSSREDIAVPQEVLQLVEISKLLDGNILEVQAQLQDLQPLSPGAEFPNVWRQVAQVFDMTQGRDLRELLNGAIEGQRKAVPIARAATERGLDRLRQQAIAMAIIALVAAVLWALHLRGRLKRPWSCCCKARGPCSPVRSSTASTLHRATNSKWWRAISTRWPRNFSSIASRPTKPAGAWKTRSRTGRGNCSRRTTRSSSWTIGGGSSSSTSAMSCGHRRRRFAERRRSRFAAATSRPRSTAMP